MSETASKAVSCADILTLAENLVGDIIAGELHTHPRPAPKHARAYSVLGGCLGDSQGRDEHILSPATARMDRVIKMPLYAREALQHIWLFDPDLQILEVYQLKEAHWSLMASLKDEDKPSQSPFDAIEFPLDSLWG